MIALLMRSTAHEVSRTHQQLKEATSKESIQHHRRIALAGCSLAATTRCNELCTQTRLCAFCGSQEEHTISFASMAAAMK